MLYGISYTNYDQKWLTRIRKPEIPRDIFKELASKGGQMVF